MYQLTKAYSEVILIPDIFKYIVEEEFFSYIKNQLISSTTFYNKISESTLYSVNDILLMIEKNKLQNEEHTNLVNDIKNSIANLFESNYISYSKIYKCINKLKPSNKKIKIHFDNTNTRHIIFPDLEPNKNNNLPLDINILYINNKINGLNWQDKDQLLIYSIIKNSLYNPLFKRNLYQEPIPTINKFCSESKYPIILPENMEIKILENSNYIRHLILPNHYETDNNINSIIKFVGLW